MENLVPTWEPHTGLAVWILPEPALGTETVDCEIEPFRLLESAVFDQEMSRLWRSTWPPKSFVLGFPWFYRVGNVKVCCISHWQMGISEIIYPPAVCCVSGLM